MPQRDPEIDEFAADEIGVTLGLTRRAADYQLSLAWGLCERLPQVWEALQAGTIDLAKARVLVSETLHLPADAARAVTTDALEHAADQTTGQLAARTRRLCIRLCPQAAKERLNHGLSERRVVAEANPDGTANLFGLHLSPEKVADITRRINHLARQAKTADDPRNIDQVRADIFTELLQGTHLGKEPKRRPVIDIAVNLDTLTGTTNQPAEIPGWGPVLADIARQIVTDQPHAQWRINLTHPTTGETLWTGTTRRRPTSAQRREVTARRRTCVFWGCRMPAIDCDLDHTQARQDHGPTHTCNLAPLCRHHHRVKHHPGWHLKRIAPNQYRWTTPHNHHHTRGPDPP